MPRDWIDILPTLLSSEAATAFVTDAGAGGVCLFLGTTRGDTFEGRAVIALDYEAYPEMALAEMKRLVAEARGKWPIVGLAMLHRVGRVGLGEPSVAIAISTPHREQAFTACRWLIDSLKATVPIWKKEVFGDGSGAWVHPEK